MGIMGILSIVIIAGIVAMNYKGGIWSSFIRLICMLTAALLATNLFEWMGALIEGYAPSMWQFGDFFAAWLVFSVVLFGLTYLTMKLSFTNVRFSKSLDLAGGAFFSALMGWVFVCFMGMTLHVAPLEREPIWGSFQAEQPMLFGLYPDRMWLGFVQNCSLGVYSRGEQHAFDPNGDFILRGIAKRERFQNAKETFATRAQTDPAGS